MMLATEAAGALDLPAVVKRKSFGSSSEEEEPPAAALPEAPLRAAPAKEHSTQQ